MKLPSDINQKLMIRVRRKHFLGAKSLGKDDLDLVQLIEAASSKEGAWIPLYKDETRKAVSCEVRIRIRVSDEIREVIERFL